MKRIIAALSLLPLAAVLAGNAPVPSSPSLGTEEARCRANEPGPALLIEVQGLRDRQGRVRAELYPATDDGFLADDNVLVNSGRVFRRVEVSIPATGAVVLCMRIPAAGRYTLSLMHDRNSDRRFSVWSDGIGFPNNPRLGRSRPPASAATFTAGAGVTRVPIVMNYLQGLSMRPLRRSQ